MNPNFRNFALWAIIALMLIALFNMFDKSSRTAAAATSSYSQFLQDVDGPCQDGDDRRRADHRHLQRFRDRASRPTRRVIPVSVDRLNEGQGVEIRARPEVDGSNSFWSYLITWLPMIIILGVWIFFMRQMQGGGSRRHGIWQVEGQAADRGAWPGDLRRRGRRG
jgi:cell division protease FtsH